MEQSRENTCEAGYWGDSLVLVSTTGQCGAQIHLGLFVLIKIIYGINEEQAYFKIKYMEECKSDENMVLEFLNIHFILLFKFKWKQNFTSNIWICCVYLHIQLENGFIHTYPSTGGMESFHYSSSLKNFFSHSLMP